MILLLLVAPVGFSFLLLLGTARCERWVASEIPTQRDPVATEPQEPQAGEVVTGLRPAKRWDPVPG